MQYKLPSKSSFVTIGRPAVSHHYKPKAKPRDSQIKSKGFLKAKKYDYSGRTTKVSQKKIREELIKPVVKEIDKNKKVQNKERVVSTYFE